MRQLWRTYDDRVVPMETMDHQHMSNIHFYINVTCPEFYDNDIREWITAWLVRRFAGVILPYRPVCEFAFEKARLQSKGYLKGDDVVVEGQKIGSYECNS